MHSKKKEEGLEGLMQEDTRNRQEKKHVVNVREQKRKPRKKSGGMPVKVGKPERGVRVFKEGNRSIVQGNGRQRRPQLKSDKGPVTYFLGMYVKKLTIGEYAWG